MAKPLAHSGGASLRARSKALPHSTFVYFGLLDEKSIDVDALRVLGIRHCCPYRLGDDSRRTLRNEFQDIERILDALTADLVDN